jgi:hypothetical protein
VEREGATVPPHDGGRLHDPDGSAPGRPNPGQPDPQEPIGATEARPFRRGLLKHGELVTEGENPGLKFSPCTDTGPNGRKDGNQNGEHVVDTVPVTEARFKRDTMYRISDMHTSVQALNCWPAAADSPWPHPRKPLRLSDQICFRYQKPVT